MSMSTEHTPSAVRAGYESLANILDDALNQAQNGKGHERHATGLPFDQQPMQKLIDLYGTGFALGQAAKKAQEAQRLPYERARAELLGAINYLSGAVIAMDRKHIASLTSVTASVTFDVIARPKDAPAWANGDGRAGAGKYRVWISESQYAYKNDPKVVRKIGDVCCWEDREIERTSFFDDAPTMPANDNRAPCRCGGCPDSTCEGRQRG